ncbi:hypothetical protein C8Q80DRAFT_1091161 [Daedaleopsis nitida]|nr:hypothetical protein C8Q80DRAFT_1091161 [Daedaleopsis nitida]
MPIHESPDPAAPLWVTQSAADSPYLIFYASRDESGRMWCPDCVRVESLIQEAFGPAGRPPATIVYVGQRPEWKTPSNPFRTSSWDVRSIPTVIRTRDGARLVDEEITQEGLAAFTA